MKKLVICLTGFLSLIIIFIMPCYAEECPGDIDCDGVVDGKDLAALATDYGKTGCTNQSFGAIYVYSADGEFLGINFDGKSIYVPDMAKFFEIGKNYDPFPGEGVNGYIFSQWIGYESSDCTGTPYTNVKVSEHHYILRSDDEFGVHHHYIMPFSSDTIYFNSRREHRQPCIEISFMDSDARPLTEVIRLPFTYPISLPLRYEMTEK